MEESDPLIIRKTQSSHRRNFFCVPSSWIDSYEYSEQDSKNGFLSTIVLLFNSMIGSGVLVQAYVFMKSGILNATAMYLIFGFMTFFGVSILAKTADSQCIFDFSSLVHKAVGYQGVFWYDLSVVVQNAGSMISYFLIISTLTVDIVESVSESTATSTERWIKIGVTIGCFVLMLPLCLIRNFGHLYSISYISTTTIVGTVLIVVLTGLFSLGTSTDDDSGLLLGSTMGSFETLGSVVFAFGYSQNLLYAHSATQDRLREVTTFDNMIKITHLTGVLLCYLIGFFGYYAFRDNTESDILESYTTGVWSILVKVPFIIHLILFIPGDFLVFRYSLLKLLGSSIKTVSSQHYMLLTVVSLVLIVTTSLVLQLYYSSSAALDIVLEITGGLSSSMLAFIFPAIVAMKLLPYHWESQLIIISLFVVGVVVPIVVLSGLIYEYV